MADLCDFKGLPIYCGESHSVPIRYRSVSYASDGKWIAFADAFGLSATGDTEDEARENLESAVSAFVEESWEEDGMESLLASLEIVVDGEDLIFKRREGKDASRG